MSHRSILAALALLAATTGHLALQAQVRLQPQAQLGGFVPAAALGDHGNSRGRLQKALVLGIGIDLIDRSSPFGVRASGIAALTDGARFEPTASCRVGCQASGSSFGQFAALSADATVRFQVAGSEVRLVAGPAYRAYRVPELVCACDPPVPGEFRPYSVEESHVVGHLGLEVWRRVGEIDLGLQLQDYWGQFRLTGRAQHDLLLLVAVRLP